MANIVEELMVVLGFDQTALLKGAKDADAALTKTKERALARAKEIEAANNTVTNSFEKIAAAALGFFAVLSGASSLKDFVADASHASAEMGRFAANLDLPTESVSTFVNAIQKISGSKADATSALQTIGDAMEDVRLHAKTDRIFPLLQLGVQIDPNASPIQNWLAYAKGVDQYIAAGHTRRDAAKLLGESGLTPGASNVLLKGYAANIKLLRESGIDAITKEQAEAAQRLQTAWVGAQQAVSSLGNEVARIVSGPLGDMLKQLQTWVETNKEVIATWVGDRFKDFVEAVKSIDWKALKQGTSDFAAAVRSVVDAVGGWKKASEDLLILWSVSKLFPVITAVTGLTTAFAASSAAAGPLVAALAAILAGYAALKAINPKALEWAEQGFPMSDQYKRDKARVDASQKAAIDAAGGRWELFLQHAKEFFTPKSDKTPVDPATSGVGYAAPGISGFMAYPLPSGAQANALYAKLMADRKASASASAEAQPLKVSGTEVSSGNPLPVRLIGEQGTQSFWDWLTGGVSAGGAGSAPQGSLWHHAQRLLGLAGGDELASASGAGNLTKLIDEVAARHKIDPRIMEGIRAGESGHGNRYDRKDDAVESSWGPFQLNRRSGLGVTFERDTAAERARLGFGDLRDPRTIPLQADWVARYIAAGGSLAPWAGYHGPRNADPRWGDAGYTPTLQGAPVAAAQPFVVGDSIAQGVQRALGAEGVTRVGAAPKEIMGWIDRLAAGSLAGKTAILSGGASNSVADAEMTRKEIEALKAKGASGVTLLGVGDRADFAAAKVNDRLRKIAAETGATFVELGKTLGGVHPANYADVAARAKAARSQAQALVKTWADVAAAVHSFVAPLVNAVPKLTKVPGVITGASGAAQATTVNHLRTSQNNISTEYNFGPLAVHSAATDANGVARDLTSSLRQRLGANALSAANFGLT